jgi:hypothetical protein
LERRARILPCRCRHRGICGKVHPQFLQFVAAAHALFQVSSDDARIGPAKQLQLEVAELLWSRAIEPVQAGMEYEVGVLRFGQASGTVGASREMIIDRSIGDSVKCIGELIIRQWRRKAALHIIPRVYI